MVPTSRVKDEDMHPPPSTPTPRRFLLPKRGTQTSQTPTAARDGTPKFQSTPRFGAPLSSAIRPVVRRSLSQEIEDVDEAEEDEDERVVSSSACDEERVATSSLGDDKVSLDEMDRARLGDEIVEDEPQQLKDLWVQGQDIVFRSESSEQRKIKRRRLSLSEEMASSPAIEEFQAILSEDDERQIPVKERLQESGLWTDSEEESIDPMGPSVVAQQQPTFRAAPRFKPTEGDMATEGLLPAAFSPQRRGAKYVPGGLAAELQAWLSDVKRWDEDGGAVANIDGELGRTRFRISVEESSRDGGRLYLVKGRIQGQRDGEEWRSRFILAGEGRLTGLGRTVGDVREGAEVDVEGPVWDVELEGWIWMVCCEWWIV